MPRSQGERTEVLCTEASFTFSAGIGILPTILHGRDTRATNANSLRPLRPLRLAPPVSERLPGEKNVRIERNSPCRGVMVPEAWRP